MTQSVTVSVTLLAASVALAAPARAQQSPLLAPAVQQAIVEEVSGDIAFEHIRWFTHYHRPVGGGEGYEAVARYVEEKAKEYGLEDVRTIRLATDTPSWSPRLGELWLLEPARRRLAFTPEVALSLADFSRTSSVASAPLVDVGDGVRDADYAEKSVEGAVVLATGPLARVMDEAVWKRGALGVVWFTTARKDFPDQVPWARIPVESSGDPKKPGTFAFVLSQREGLRLRAQLAAAGDRPYRVSAKVESEFHATSSQSIVEAVIRGSGIGNQDIVLTGHLQEERFSANDDASGCASVLEIARALKRMIDDGRLPRPRRDIRFWWVDEISAPERYFADHPEERGQFLANINQDMVGGKQSAGSRVQFVTRPPSSRAGVLGDVVESIVESLVQGNTAYLSAGMARQLRRGDGAVSGGSVATDDQQYSRPVLARLGTRERYDARVIPFHNSTDHQVFNMAPIGIPGLTFTNWPDDYIHSSDDDLWQMDATQLKRNAVAVASAAWFLATAGEAEARTLAGEMLGRALARQGADAARAAALVSSAAEADRAEARSRAITLVRESAARERRAAATLAALDQGSPAVKALVAAVTSALPTPDAAEARLVSVLPPGPRPEPSARERELSLRVPRFVDDVGGFLERRRRIDRPAGLHTLMAFEVLNFVDGSRSYVDVFRAVSAEADAAGDWYYGRVTLDDVASYLDSAASAGVVSVETRPAAPAGTPRKGRQ